ncbi:helix-turn-helix domain-containing protein [Dysosmobacter sp.]|uniref:helix-turn-helix domain-containing protein n=1 Tax=Dysosmobacter sp. TaxID=2591382 RepID=UPI002A9299A3|nr:helix-turn-helix transcriptional regulator [Dysosmobacter sp.]MDY5611881.1 helix-turn-helix transcriptional regulator [Dysosmobacter sp.]
MTLGEKIQTLRTDAGLSQEYLAEQLAVSRQAVSKWELDKTVPDVKYIVALSGLFDVTTDFLLKDDSKVMPPKTQALASPPSPVSQESVCPLTAPKSPDRSCLLLDVSLCLFVLLILVYLADYCFMLSLFTTRWPLLVVLLGTPVILLASLELLTFDTSLRRFRRGVAGSCMLWGFSMALLCGFSEVFFVLTSQVGGIASLFLSLLLIVLFLPFWYAGRLLANYFTKRRNP